MIRDRNILPPHYDRVDRAESSDANRWPPDHDEAPSLDTLPHEDDRAWESYPAQRDPGRRVRKFIPEVDDPDDASDDTDDTSPERRRRPVLAGIMSVLLLALIGSGGAALWFYYGPAFSAASPSEVDKTAEVINRLADEQRKLAQAVSALQQSIQDSLQKEATAREQDTQRLSAQAEALKADFDGLRAAIANATTRPPIAHAPKSAAVQPQKKGSDRKPAPPPLQAEAPPPAPPPEH